MFQWVALEDGPRCLVATCAIGERDPASLQFIDWDEIKTFKTEKRRNEHLSARWLLEESLKQWGDIDASQLMISRTDERAPYLTFKPYRACGFNRIYRAFRFHIVSNLLVWLS